MRSSCTLLAPLSTTQLSTPNDVPEAKSTARRGKWKALQSTCHPHCITIHCLQIWVSQQPQGLLYSQNWRGDLPSLLSKLVGQASELFQATWPQCPAGRGWLEAPAKHSAHPQGSPDCRRDQLSHLSHRPVCSEQQQLRRIVMTLAKETDDLPAKTGNCLLLTRASSSLRLPQKKLRQIFFSNPKKPEKVKTSLLFKCFKRQADAISRQAHNF